MRSPDAVSTATAATAASASPESEPFARASASPSGDSATARPSTVEGRTERSDESRPNAVAAEDGPPEAMAPGGPDAVATAEPSADVPAPSGVLDDPGGPEQAAR